ncbi:hypothetical protein BC826DRAFT_38655 [Russula brevipes]|nr:hypothetical protein BC826DRAFT_38655 [Russula brevipes]
MARYLCFHRIHIPFFFIPRHWLSDPFFFISSIFAVLMRSSVQIATNVLVGLMISHSALAAPVQSAANGLVLRSLAHAGREVPAVPVTVNPIILDPTETTNPVETTNPIIPGPAETTNPIIPNPTETTNPIGPNPTETTNPIGPNPTETTNPIGPDPTETTNPIGPDPAATADPALASLLDQLTKGLTDSIIFDPRSSGKGRNARQSLEEPDGSDGDQFHILPIPFDPNSDVVPDPTVTVAPDPSGIFIPKDPDTTIIPDPSVTISSPEPDATFFPDPSVTVAPDLTTTRLPFLPTLEVDPLGKNFIVRAL